MGWAKVNLIPLYPWAARYNTWLLITLTPKGVVFSFLFYSSLRLGLRLTLYDRSVQTR